jgi:hypothetical protein
LRRDFGNHIRQDENLPRVDLGWAFADLVKAAVVGESSMMSGTTFMKSIDSGYTEMTWFCMPCRLFSDSRGPGWVFNRGVSVRDIITYCAYGQGDFGVEVCRSPPVMFEVPLCDDE